MQVLEQAGDEQAGEQAGEPAEVGKEACRYLCSPGLAFCGGAGGVSPYLRALCCPEFLELYIFLKNLGAVLW